MSESSWREQSIVAEFGKSRSAMDVTRRVLQSQSSPQGAQRHTFAIPGGDAPMRAGLGGSCYPIADLINIELPPKSTCDVLVDVYFYTVHWFSLVVYEPVFRRRYEAIVSSGMAARTDRPFLVLILMVLAMSCHYGQGLTDSRLPNPSSLISLRVKFLEVVRQNFWEFLDGENLEFIQISTLLGSYWLYWGKPRSSFTILGAAVRSAQAISLHRQADWQERDPHAVEERKRVWWTIYTWDRFATIVYGRPVGIRDKDCDVQMPAVFAEQLTDLQTTATVDVELSPYQTSLNSVYQVASPLIENIYGIRSSGGSSLSVMADTVQQVHQALQSWHAGLPTSLNIADNPDLNDDSDLRAQMHQLQSLSLQLTYLNLKIIIHRPLLADWSQRRMYSSRAQSVPDEYHAQQEELRNSERQVYDINFQYCLEAALEISQLERKKPNLVRLASKTHLLSFLAMNVFTSSVVLYICALSDVLSDAAQMAKRGISNNLRLLRSLSSLGSLSSQCSVVIEDLVQMILERERIHILLPPPSAEQVPSSVPQTAWADDNSPRPRDAMSETSDLQGRHTNIDTGSWRTQHAHGFYDAPRAGGAVSFEQTMEQLQKVLKDASQSRSQQPSYQPTAAGEGTGDTELNATWTPPYSNPVAFGNEYALPTQDMGQLWLWETGLNSLDMTGSGNFGYDAM